MALDSVSPAALGAAPAASSSSDAEARLERLRGLRPRLAPYVRIGSVRQRGRTVYRAHDRLGGRTLELTPLAAELLLACAAGRTVFELSRIAGARRPEAGAAAVSEQVLQILGAAENHGLLLPLERRAEGYAPIAQPGLLMRTLKNPLFARFSFFNPDPLIERLAPLAHLLFSPPALIAWLAMVGFGVYLAIGNWDELFAYGATHALAPGSLVWMAVLFPLVKLLHELGHALACKRWGGEVRDFGTSLLVFMPIPFVDCSDSAFFVRRRQRIAVAAAGMMVEFVLAFGALIVWLVSTDDFVRLIAFNTMVLTSITTIAFNANPLLRFDAYYILSELIGMDNLGTRAQALIGGLSRRIFLGDANAPAIMPPPGERIVLLLYGLGSTAYKFFIVFFVVINVFPRFFVFGVVLAAWGAMSMIVLPLAKQARTTADYLKKADGAVRVKVLTRAAIGLVLLGGLLLVPLPYAVVADGAVRLPPESVLRSGGAGIVTALPRGVAGEVAAGEPLVLLDNPLLHAELNARRAGRVSQERRYEALLASNMAEAGLLAAELAFAAEDIASAEDAVARLVVAAPATGRFELADALEPGIQVEEGDPLGVVLPPTDTRTAIIVVSQEDADLIGSRLEGVTVRPVRTQSVTRPARILRDYHLSVAPPPDAAPGAPPPPVLEARFAFELEIDAGADLPYGQAMKARFDLGLQPLSLQLWRSLNIWFEKIMLSRHMNQGA
ncbi:hypothetical protein EMQ25_13180 [Arsenicitalea aurantiaca]|uniref:HlyD family efflux transporter periplasmic adaptor subunit n=1 Tax=Arsenicitalea aurantiaca TaxID=1783274 RepID=A0A433X874_9HYPH|nr:hypothetical protein [Arsenicitalea aurantiaca]RUT30262.1 hypothetical protein EMQ25_13180 [Arsenicitalea aurantiaca]